MQANVAVFERIRDSVLLLTAEERLRLIQSIATLAPTYAAPTAEVGKHANKLADEEAAWYAMSPQQKAPYRGQYVAIHDGRVVDADIDRRSLYVRVRQRFGQEVVPILNADWDEPPEYEFCSPQLER